MFLDIVRMGSSGLTAIDGVDDAVVSVRLESLGDDNLPRREPVVFAIFNVGVIGAGTCGTVVAIWGDIDLCDLCGAARFGELVFMY
jgi:hypothetical protein